MCSAVTQNWRAVSDRGVSGGVSGVANGSCCVCGACMCAVGSISMLPLSRQDYQRIRPSSQGKNMWGAQQLTKCNHRREDVKVGAESNGGGEQRRGSVFSIRIDKTNKKKNWHLWGDWNKVRDTKGKVPRRISPGVFWMGRWNCMQIKQWQSTPQRLRQREKKRVNVGVWNEKGCSTVMGQMVISWPRVTI